MDENNVETVDFGQKKLTLHSTSHNLHSIFWTKLINKNRAFRLFAKEKKSFGNYDRRKVLLAETVKK